MHIRLACAAVDEASTDPLFGALTPEEAFAEPGPTILWARRRLLLDAQGRRAAVAISRRGAELRVCVIDTSTGRSSWQPAEKVLTSATADAWRRQTAFFK